VSSLVCGGPSAQLVLFNGGLLTVQAIAKSAVVNGTLVLTSAQLQNLQFVGADGNVGCTVQAYGSYGSTDAIWTVGAATEVQGLGLDNQPITLTPVLGSALVP
jgi:hypothetical protein